MAIKTIAVLTSGGDSPGMNPAIRSVVRTATRHGVRSFGILNGYAGIFQDEVLELTDRSMLGVLERGGTILQTSRCEEFFKPEGIDLAARKLREHRFEGLVVIGGDGSLKGAHELHKRGIPVIGIPGSIDNDIGCTEMCVGVDTACNTIIESIDKIKDTARSHSRCFLIEVMGRRSGYLGLATAITSGAEVAILPEFQYDLNRILTLLDQRYKTRRSDSIIILAEGVMEASEFCKILQNHTDGPPLKQDVRLTVLGHVQRGGRPSHFDSMLAARMGELAVTGLIQGESAMMTAWRKGRITLVDLNDVVNTLNPITSDTIRLARSLGIELGIATVPSVS